MLLTDDRTRNRTRPWLRRAGEHRLGRREWTGLALAATGLAFLAVTVPASQGASGYSLAALIAFESAAIGAGFAMLASGTLGNARREHGVVLGAASGVLVGVANVSIKALTESSAGLWTLLSPWSAVILVAGVGAFFALARGMQLGDAIPVIATASVASNCAAILGGVIVFGDPIGSGLVEGLARGAAFVAVIAAAALMPGVGIRRRAPAPA